MIRGILAKLLFCDRDNLGNVLLHIPVGVINVLVPVALYLILGMPGAILGGCVALIFGTGFVAYEVVEGVKIKDKIFPDIDGWLWGMGLTVGLIFVVWLCIR